MAKLKKRKDGRYQRKITLSTGKVRIVYGKTLAELKAAEDAVRAEDSQGLAVGDHTLVGEWARIWLDSYKQGLRASTVRMYRDAYNLHILSYLGKMELRDVKPVHVRAVMSGVADRSDSLQHKVLLTMRQMFQTARLNGLILNDPTEGIRPTKHARPEKKKYLTQQEMELLMQNVTNERARAFCGLCLYCGLRKEEALGLRWSDILDGKLTVNQTVTFLSNQQDTNHELKTKAAHRTVPVPQKMLDILAETPRLGVYIVPAADGSEMTRSAYTKMWNLHVRRVVPFPVHAHMLRHTYATTLYRAGVDLRTAQKLLSHSSIQMTADIYTHLEAEDSMAVSEQLNSYLNGKQSQTEEEHGSEFFSKSSQTVVNPA